MTRLPACLAKRLLVRLPAPGAAPCAGCLAWLEARGQLPAWHLAPALPPALCIHSPFVRPHRAGGVILPDSAKERPLSGTVVRCGPGRLGDDGERKAPKVRREGGGRRGGRGRASRRRGAAVCLQQRFRAARAPPYPLPLPSCLNTSTHSSARLLCCSPALLLFSLPSPQVKEGDRSPRHRFCSPSCSAHSTPLHTTGQGGRPRHLLQVCRGRHGDARGREVQRAARGRHPGAPLMQQQQQSRLSGARGEPSRGANGGRPSRFGRRAAAARPRRRGA